MHFVYIKDAYYCKVAFISIRVEICIHRIYEGLDLLLIVTSFVGSNQCFSLLFLIRSYNFVALFYFWTTRRCTEETNSTFFNIKDAYYYKVALICIRVKI